MYRRSRLRILRGRRRHCRAVFELDAIASRFLRAIERRVGGLEDELGRGVASLAEIGCMAVDRDGPENVGELRICPSGSLNSMTRGWADRSCAAYRSRSATSAVETTATIAIVARA